MILNKQNRVIGFSNISKGGTHSTIVDAKVIYSLALKLNASAIFLAHNHPSGAMYPSSQDKDLTQKLKVAGDVLGITFFDHIIITTYGYFSFADEGMIS